MNDRLTIWVAGTSASGVIAVRLTRKAAEEAVKCHREGIRVAAWMHNRFNRKPGQRKARGTVRAAIRRVEMLNPLIGAFGEPK